MTQCTKDHEQEGYSDHFGSLIEYSFDLDSVNNELKCDVPIYLYPRNLWVFRRLLLNEEDSD